MFTTDGFLRTGDLVRRDDAGRLVVVGRIKDVVNRGGEKISVDEVEAHLVAHPAVRTAALVPVPDPRLGEKACAVIVARDAPPSLAEVHDFLRARGLAEFKLPDRLHVAPELPYTPVGKIDRRALARELTA
ncbi:AMP-binding enzyme [Micromonospora tarapacensis]|uniref:AMP-binding enzyme n=1 Tax=Micromonospora tarapacensis TaxID=2835305 RepID=UPI002F412F75